MIVCTVKKNESNYFIQIEGHSGYDTIGKDIVCSSVSTAMIMSVNLLERLKTDFDFSSDEKIPMMKLNVNNYNEVEEKVLDNLVDCLNDVSTSYKKYLKIK